MCIKTKSSDKKLIRKLLQDFQSCHTIRRSDIINKLAKRIAKQMQSREKENIYEWAESLSEDVSKCRDHTPEENQAYSDFIDSFFEEVEI